MLSLASEQLLVTDAVETLAVSYEKQGVRAMDAVHLALASMAKVDYFCTCDDQLFRKASGLADLHCQVIGLLNLVVELSS